MFPDVNDEKSDENRRNIEFSVDLVELALKQLDFLAYIDSVENIYDVDVVERAVYRYEKKWLP